MDFATRRVFAACMSTPSKRRLSSLSFFSGAAFLCLGLCSLMLQTSQVAEVLRTICLWIVPVLMIALVVDVCRKRYWALVVLVFLVASLGILVLLIRATAQAMCCG
jgi:hypothetical protein